MRDILFKAKRIDNGEWVEGNYVNGYTFHYILPIPMAMAQSGCAIVVNKSTICQYTGLKDKNGTKIWENDIVRHEDLSNGRYIFIEQPMKNSSIVFNRNESKFERSDGRGLYKSNTRLEVVGNIFDNPELLEEKECEE